MYKIEVSNNMIIQGYQSPSKEFKTKNAAYKFGMEKWGSGVFSPLYGWSIVKVK